MKALAEEMQRIKQEKLEKARLALEEERKAHLIEKNVQNVIDMIDGKILERKQLIDNKIISEIDNTFLSRLNHQ